MNLLIEKKEEKDVTNYSQFGKCQIGTMYINEILDRVLQVQPCEHLLFVRLTLIMYPKIAQSLLIAKIPASLTTICFKAHNERVVVR